jgi:hypothetical protein
MIYTQTSIHFTGPLRFNGSDYQPEHDDARLTGQILRVFDCMKGGEWRTLAEIEELTGDPQASISAQLRHLRKERFGAHTATKRSRGDRDFGLFEYQVVVRTTTTQALVPKRIQRKREKGWRMPPGAVYVGRPTVWGNPFLHAQKHLGLQISLKLYRDMVIGIWNPATITEDHDRQIAYEAFAHWTKRFHGNSFAHIRGKDLACWCPLDQPCHAAVLLEIANS